MATGVLVLGVGRATRLLRFVADGIKRYTAEITFGVETDSLDADGEVVATHDMVGIDPDAIAAAAAALTGDIMQVPPMVSAIKVDGKRLHQLARQGIEVERSARPVHVSRFDLTPTASPLVWIAEVECSAGTYVRVLAADLGHLLGGGAHLSALRRTAVGSFTIEEATPIDRPVLLPVAEALRSLPAVTVGDDMAKRVVQGAVLSRDAVLDHAADVGPWAIFDGAGEPLAVYQSHRDGLIKPSMVLGAPAAG